MASDTQPKTYRDSLLQNAHEIRTKKTKTEKEETLDEIGSSLLSHFSFSSSDRFYFNDKTLSDVRISVNDGCKSYFAHKVILATRSEFFQKLFEDSNRWHENESNVVEITVEDCLLDCFDDFLNSFYTGRVKLGKGVMWPYYFLADQFLVSFVKTWLKNFIFTALITKTGRSSYGENYYATRELFSSQEIIEIAEYFNDEHVQQCAGTVLLSKLRATETRESFKKFSKCTILGILRGKTLENCNWEMESDEFELFKLVVEWLNSNSYDVTSAEEILTHVRYGRIRNSAQLKYISRHVYVACSAKISRLVALAAQEILFVVPPNMGYKGGINIVPSMEHAQLFTERYHQEAKKFHFSSVEDFIKIKIES